MDQTTPTTSPPPYLPSPGEALERMPPDTGDVHAQPGRSWDIPSITGWTQREKWRGLHPAFMALLWQTITTLRSMGWTNAALGDGWRPWSTQADFLATGASHTRTSYHNAVDENLVPASLAADIRAGADLNEADSTRFLRDLRWIARANGLGAGGWWNGGKGRGYADPLGWDPTHVELPLLPLPDLEANLTRIYTSHGLLVPVVPSDPRPVPLPDKNGEHPDPTRPAGGGGGVLVGGLILGGLYGLWRLFRGQGR